MDSSINAVALYALMGNPTYSARAIVYTRDLFDYARTVMSFRYEIHAAGQNDMVDFREDVLGLDSLRTSKHDRAIASLSVLGEMAAAAGTPPVFIGDLQDRKAVAKAVFGFCISELEGEAL